MKVRNVVVGIVRKISSFVRIFIENVVVGRREC